MLRKSFEIERNLEEGKNKRRLHVHGTEMSQDKSSFREHNSNS
jgi:hypothetical protein